MANLVHFSQRQYDCLDYDPFHPMIVHLSKGLSKEEALWLSTLYMAFYNIGSAYAAFKVVRPLKRPPDWVLRLPVGVQRRNHRGGRIAQHLASFSALAKAHGSIEAFLTDGFIAGSSEWNWQILKDNVQKSWGNGRWSVYTTAELYQKANGLAVFPCDIMNDGSSGPRSGLSRMFGCDLSNSRKDVETADMLADLLFEHMRKRIYTRIPYLPKGHYDYAMMESQLCDFNSLCKGRYYIGRDIDRDQERIRAAELAIKALGQRMSLAEVWAAREAVFPVRYLGEFCGWRGRTDEAKTFYQKTGTIADHGEIRTALGIMF